MQLPAIAPELPIGTKPLGVLESGHVGDIPRLRVPVAVRVRFSVGLVGLFAIYLTLFLAAWAVVPSVVPGWRSVVITSGSMSPSIRTGDVVVAAPSNGEVLSPGAVVVLSDPSRSSLITHRIVALNADGSYSTRGDANAKPDSTPLYPDQIVAVGRLRVPFVGLPLVWYRTGAWGKLALWATGTLLALWVARYVLLDGYKPRALPDGKTRGPG